MKVVGLVGTSGTGKSYKASALAMEKSIECIVDDGILICANKIIAGKSAKKEKTKIGSIKRAIFVDEQQRKEVRDAIKNINPSGVLVLGTSIDMLKAIAQKLEIGEFSEIVKIEDISTKKEIEEAKNTRTTEGKHVIPVPTFELKRDFSGYFIDKIFKKKSAQVLDKSIVRPTFSYLGEYTLDDNVIRQMAMYEIEKIKEVSKILKLSLRNFPDGIMIDVDIAAFFGTDLMMCAQKIKSAVKQPVEEYTSINVLSVNVNFIKLIMDKQEVK